MTKLTLSALLLVLATVAGSGETYAGKFHPARLGAEDVSVVNNVTAPPPPYFCVTHGHHQCPNPPGSTIPDCRGGHMGPNGVVIECK